MYSSTDVPPQGLEDGATELSLVVSKGIKANELLYQKLAGGEDITNVAAMLRKQTETKVKQQRRQSSDGTEHRVLHLQQKVATGELADPDEDGELVHGAEHKPHPTSARSKLFGTAVAKLVKKKTKELCEDECSSSAAVSSGVSSGSTSKRSPLCLALADRSSASEAIVKADQPPAKKRKLYGPKEVLTTENVLLDVNTMLEKATRPGGLISNLAKIRPLRSKVSQRQHEDVYAAVLLQGGWDEIMERTNQAAIRTDVFLQSVPLFDRYLPLTKDVIEIALTDSPTLVSILQEWMQRKVIKESDLDSHYAYFL